MKYQPHQDFDWNRVAWHGPTEPISESCSYCDAPLPEDDGSDFEGLILWATHGWSAQFCEACRRRYWGLEC